MQNNHWTKWQKIKQKKTKNIPKVKLKVHFFLFSKVINTRGRSKVVTVKTLQRTTLCFPFMQPTTFTDDDVCVSVFFKCFLEKESNSPSLPPPQWRRHSKVPDEDVKNQSGLITLKDRQRVKEPEIQHKKTKRNFLWSTRENKEIINQREY